MKRQLSVLLLAGLMTIPVGLMAQKVYKESGSNKVILEMTFASGMPDGAQTNSSKTAVYDLYTPTNNTSWLINATDNLQSGYLNATVYEKLEIAPLEMSSASSSTLGAGVAMDWQNAFLRCKGLTYNTRTGWRLPTQRELMMMWIFKGALDEIFKDMGNNSSTALPFDAYNYWCSPESGTGHAWYVYFDNGRATYNLKTTSGIRVRCVREE